MSKGKLTEEVFQVGIAKLGAPIGRQGQYATTFGGQNFIMFHQDMRKRKCG